MNFITTPTPKILFICKLRHSYGGTHSYGIGNSSGLFNSAKFVSDMLNENDVESKIVEVTDNNSIDKEVSSYQPTHAIIEALWIVPEKFEILTKLHPNVKWIIRVHSEIPFLANEGIAIEWISKYIKYPNVTVSFNSERTNEEFEAIYNKDENCKKFVYLPNYYDLQNVKKYKKHFEKKCKNTEYECSDNYCTCNIKFKKHKDEIHFGCFGAIRPLKNQLIQAVASIKFADSINKTLYFHINSQRMENRGEPVFKNIKNLFVGSKHKLVEHEWLQRSEFIELMAQMDMGLQVSFSETFNIVSADFTALNKPVVTSNEIEHTFSLFDADCTSSDSIKWKIELAWFLSKINFQFINKIKLWLMAFKAKRTWLGFVHGFDAMDIED